jgi:hypothetical protein
VHIFFWSGVGFGVGQGVHMTDTNMLVLQSCTVALSDERGLCSETSMPSSSAGNDVITLKIVGEVVRIKEEVDPIAISFNSIKDEPEVSPQTFQHYLGLPCVIVSFCLSAFPHKSAPCSEWKCSVYIYTV